MAEHADAGEPAYEDEEETMFRTSLPPRPRPMAAPPSPLDLQAVARCPHRRKCPTGCATFQCGIQADLNVTVYDCVACLKSRA